MENKTTGRKKTWYWSIWWWIGSHGLYRINWWWKKHVIFLNLPIGLKIISVIEVEKEDIIILSTEKYLSEKQADLIRVELQNVFSTKPNRVLILDGGMKIGVMKNV